MLGKHSSAELHPQPKDLILDHPQIPKYYQLNSEKRLRSGQIRFRGFGGTFLSPFLRGLIS